MGCSLSKKIDSWLFGSKYINILVVGDTRLSYVEKLINNRYIMFEDVNMYQPPRETSRKYKGVGWYVTLYTSDELDYYDGVMFIDCKPSKNISCPFVSLSTKGKKGILISYEEIKTVDDAFKCLLNKI